MPVSVSTVRWRKGGPIYAKREKKIGQACTQVGSVAVSGG